ncbi:MAG TPA: hypothetical protein VJH88_05145 [Candidatus Nanoarchaeia archaeon]|nr:hypothetical protein [Candidatus Nanoarchaeia archaeon]
MSLQQSINGGYAQIIQTDIIKAKSLLKSAHQAVISAQKIPFETDTLKSILRELYEGLRQYCEALGCQRGYKFKSHEVIAVFIEEILKDKKIALKFDRYRKLRNGINYYGDDISPTTVKEALDEIPQLIKQLEEHIK